MGDLGRKVALVTGAGAGLGRAVTIALAEAGAEVVAVSLDPEELHALERETSKRGLDVLTFAADVGSESDTARVAERVFATKGRVDVLVNNAGVIDVKPITDTTVADWDRVLSTNLRAVFLYTASFLPGMKERRDGVILNVSSRAGVRGRANEVVYTASKFGVEGFSRALAAELAPWEIAVATVEPGVLIRTKMSETTYSAREQRRWRDPSEIAPAFVRLAADGRSFSGKRVNAWNLAKAAVV
jgi:NAD(P)-dependent dehydrogenase (short-subunit alcohol dehydrogenase family)